MRNIVKNIASRVYVQLPAKTVAHCEVEALIVERLATVARVNAELGSFISLAGVR